MAICAGNSPLTGEFPAQRPVTRSFDVFFDLRLNKRLSKQSWGWWFERLSCPLWRHSNVVQITSCHRFRAKPLYEPMMDNCQLDPWEQISVTFELKYKNFHTKNLIEKYHLQNDCHFVSDTPDDFSGAPFHIFNQDLLLTAPTQFFYHHGDQIAVGIIQSTSTRTFKYVHGDALF